MDTPIDLPYQCPGDSQPISEAVHLGRLASFFPACRQCTHRDQTGTLSPLQIELLRESRRRADVADVWTGEGLAGVYLNDITAANVRAAAAAMGTVLLRQLDHDAITSTKRQRSSENAAPMPSTLSLARRAGIDDDRERHPLAAPRVFVVSDGRAMAAELVAAVSAGLLYSGCDVVLLDSMFSAELVWAMHAHSAGGGVLVGNPLSKRHTVGLSLWGPAAAFWSGEPGGVVSSVRKLAEPGPAESRLADQAPARQVRTCGALARRRLETEYHDSLRPYFHALRPLRVRVETACHLLAGRLQGLARDVACQIELVHPSGDRPPESLSPRGGQPASPPRPVAQQPPHLCIWIDGDGEVCRVRDELGRELSGDHLVALFAAQLCREQPGAKIVMERISSAESLEAIGRAGGVAVTAPSSREAMSRAMRRHGALLGGGPSGRVWFGRPCPHPDALRTLATLLVLLSQSDRALSDVQRAVIFGAEGQ